MKVYVACLLLLCLVLAAVPSVAGTLYDNGPRGPDADAWVINLGFAVSDTFTLTANSTINGLSFNAWLFPGDTQLSAEVSISSEEFGGTTFFDQTATFTQSDCAINAYGFNVCEETASFNGPALQAGTYWLNLQNASVPSGNSVYWDENSGAGCQSPGCPSLASESAVGTIPSESFTILGNISTGTMPEPATILLLGTGVFALAGLGRKAI